jgi:hypothetical protein
MIPEKIFQPLLALGEALRVNRIDYVAAEGQVLIGVVEPPVLWAQEKCLHCGKAVRGYNTRRNGGGGI